MSDVNAEVVESAAMEDAMEAENRAYKESAQLPVSKIAGYVLDVVGQRISAVAVGLSDARPIRLWQEGKEIRDENDGRLRLLYRVAKTVASIYDESTARAFLRASSPYLSDSSPAQAIAANRDVEVLEALRSFLEG